MNDSSDLAQAEINSLTEENAELEAIVRDLAGDDDDCPSTESGNCRFCRVELPAYRLDQHEFDCAWRRAVEWVAAHPVSGDQP